MGGLSKFPLPLCGTRRMSMRQVQPLRQEVLIPRASRAGNSHSLHLSAASLASKKGFGGIMGGSQTFHGVRLPRWFSAGRSLFDQDNHDRNKDGYQSSKGPDYRCEIFDDRAPYPGLLLTRQLLPLTRLLAHWFFTPFPGTSSTAVSEQCSWGRAAKGHFKGYRFAPAELQLSTGYWAVEHSCCRYAGRPAPIRCGPPRLLLNASLLGQINPTTASLLPLARASSPAY